MTIHTALAPDKRGAYLAALFDSGISVQIRQRGKKIVCRMSKTSRNPYIPTLLYSMTGYGKTYFTEMGGLRWAVDDHQEIRDFLEYIEPFVLLRREEILFAIDVLNNNTNHAWDAATIQEAWEDIRRAES